MAKPEFEVGERVVTSAMFAYPFRQLSGKVVKIEKHKDKSLLQYTVKFDDNDLGVKQLTASAYHFVLD